MRARKARGAACARGRARIDAATFGGSSVAADKFPRIVTDWTEEDNPWRVNATRRAFENDWFSILDHAVTRPDGTPGSYAVIHVRRLAVGVLPIDAEGHVHLVGQWRFALGRYSWEMPEGGAERGEAPEACARRELAEETGLSAGTLVKILEMDLSNSVTDERAILYLALDLTPGAPSPEGTERLQLLRAPFREALARASDGRISDALTVAALLRAHHMASEGALPARVAQAILAR
jgi:8-oxo-dGTP pyrophosphatase MutT (NUDIX family)